MRKISYTNRFLKDYKQIKKRGWDIQQLETFVVNGGPSPELGFRRYRTA